MIVKGAWDLPLPHFGSLRAHERLEAVPVGAGGQPGALMFQRRRGTVCVWRFGLPELVVRGRSRVLFVLGG